jgi:hypothetical protein
VIEQLGLDAPAVIDHLKARMRSALPVVLGPVPDPEKMAANAAAAPYVKFADSRGSDGLRR